MDSQELERLVAHYTKMEDDEIANIHANWENLTDEARAAVLRVIVNKKVDLAKIRQEDAEDAYQQDEGRKKSLVKKEKRNGLLLIIFVVIFVSVSIFRVLTEPELTSKHAYQTFLSVIIQGVFIFLILWVVSGIKRLVSKK
jgi:predicted Fe-S protein YdhL (DUF1289 family)